MSTSIYRMLQEEMEVQRGWEPALNLQSTSWFCPQKLNSKHILLSLPLHPPCAARGYKQQRHLVYISDFQVTRLYIEEL